jgi:alkanesulfonate monooxygenase SsuD/methylene tetrahydromethanopterin reductase-like flavin-dependent oxidoreductase (luciferase family)
MVKKISFGIISLQRNSWDEEIRRWKHIEELGFDSAWLGDHYCIYSQPTEPWLEGWTLLAALANVTKRIKIGTLVTSVFLRHPPMLARQAMTVDHISKGRLILGLGTGLPGSPEFPMVGIPDYPAGERVQRFNEAVEIIDQLLSNQSMKKYEGEFYQLVNSNIYPPPIQKPRPPIMIAAMGDKMLKTAVKYGDTWNSYGGRGLSPQKIFEKTVERNEKINEFCNELGRDPKTLKRSILIYGKEAFNLFKKEDNFTKYVEKYSEIGIEEFIFYYPGKENLQKTMEKVAKEVMPSFR